MHSLQKDRKKKEGNKERKKKERKKERNKFIFYQFNKK
jgi:hypothetical protein